jgi:hypothetical protein
VFLHSGRIYDNGFSTSELWKNDTLRPDISWMWFVCGCPTLCAEQWKSMLDASWLLIIVWYLCLMHQIWGTRGIAVYYLYLLTLYLLIFLELLTSLLAYFEIHFLFDKSIIIPVMIIRRKYNTTLYYTILLQHPCNGITKLFFASKKEVRSITINPLTNMSLFVT